MSKTDEKIMAMVEAELNRNPEISSTELHEKAKALGPGAGKLSLRQFHARYPLQVKRRRGAAAGGGGTGRSRNASRTASRRKRGAPPESRDAVRKVFMDFATDLTARIAADGPHGAVKLLAQVDSYVERALTARGRR